MKQLFGTTLFLLSFALFITGVRLMQQETLVSGLLEAETASDNAAELNTLQQKLADNVIRLHVIANSDTENDQALKLRVRDAIINDLQDNLRDVKDREGAQEIIRSQIQQITDTAHDTILANGYSYDVTVQLAKRSFPEKTYGDLTFPSGEYDSLCVEIGASAGHNWWCVLFPSLCFIDETTATVPDESKDRLRDNLGNDDYERLETYSESTNDREEKDLEIHSAIYDWICAKIAPSKTN